MNDTVAFANTPVPSDDFKTGYLFYKMYYNIKDPKDNSLQKAAQFFLKGYENQNCPYCTGMLAEFYAYGVGGLKKDITKAFNLAKKSNEANCAIGSYMLGSFYLNGSKAGLPQNKESGEKLTYKIGTMIEIPRAALTADEIAKTAEFFSFGTNDLTQMTFGFSRDDAGKFLGAYYDKKLFDSDPFAHLDQVGVGKLVDMACKLGRSTRPDIKLGICGEHGGDPQSIEFCHRVGLTYVSCSPYRVPIARLAAAQANIKNPK